MAADPKRTETRGDCLRCLVAVRLTTVPAVLARSSFGRARMEEEVEDGRGSRRAPKL